MSSATNLHPQFNISFARPRCQSPTNRAILVLQVFALEMNPYQQHRPDLPLNNKNLTTHQHLPPACADSRNLAAAHTTTRSQEQHRADIWPHSGNSRSANQHTSNISHNQLNHNASKIRFAYQRSSLTLYSTGYSLKQQKI